MLHPFAPKTMNRLRQSLNLNPEVYNIDQFATGIEAGHQVGQLQEFSKQKIR